MVVLNTGYPPIRVVVLAAPRTGSNLLCTLLNSHPDVLCHHEIFNPDGIFYAITHRDGSLDLGSIQARDREPLTYLDRVWRAHEGKACVGFKMTRGQNEQVLAAVLADAGIEKVVLKRRNPVKTYVSERLAQRTGRWEAYRGSELAPPPSKVYVELSELRAHMACNARYYEAIERTLAATGQACSVLLYEELLDPARHREMLQALRVRSDVPLHPGSVKQNVRDLAQLIENFQELTTQVEGTDLEPAFHDRAT